MIGVSSAFGGPRLGAAGSEKYRGWETVVENDHGNIPHN